MRRKDREVTDFNEIIKIIDECEIIRLGIADGDVAWDWCGDVRFDENFCKGDGKCGGG